MYVLGFSLDNLSLMALTIAVGFVVDDAIVVVENIYRHIEAGEKPYQAALRGAGEIGFTVFSISLSLVAVFIPLLLMEGIIGRLMREFALTVTVTIAVSLIVSLTLTPMLCSRFLKPEEHKPGWLNRQIGAFFDALAAGYERTLSIALRARFITLMSLLRNARAHDLSVYQHPEGLLPGSGYRHPLRRDRRAAGYRLSGDV